MTRQQRIRQNEALRLKYEKAFYAPIRNAIANQLRSFTSDLLTYGTSTIVTREIAERPIANMDAELWNKGLAPIIQQLYVSAALAKANATLSELRRLPKVQKKRTSFGYNEQWTQEVLRYFESNLFNKVVLPISDTTKEYIQKIISKGIDEGWSIKQMTDEIERADYLDGRVRRILRTESNRAINYGNELAMDKFEYKVQKQWVAVHDDRTRHAHLAADGQTVNQDGVFTVGGEQMEFPGDPNASGANTINCRCFSEVVAIRDENGRLIPKDAQPQVRVTGRLRSELRNILAELTS